MFNITHKYMLSGLHKLGNCLSSYNKTIKSTLITSISVSISTIFLYRIFTKRDKMIYFTKNMFYIAGGYIYKLKKLLHCKKNNSPDDSLSSKTLSYENRYYETFSKLTDKKLDDDHVKKLRNNILYEMTPKGRVILYYDVEKEGFSYYCDTKDIPYKYLEAVAHKYAITYDCKNLVVDMKNELNKSVILSEKQGSNETLTSILKTSTQLKENTNNSKSIKKTVSIENDMFVNYKQYNRKGSGGNIIPNKQSILKNKSNKYTYLGKMKDYSFIQRDKYVIQKKEEEFNYAAFKSLNGTV